MVYFRFKNVDFLGPWSRYLKKFIDQNCINIWILPDIFKSWTTAKEVSNCFELFYMVTVVMSVNRFLLFSLSSKFIEQKFVCCCSNNMVNAFIVLALSVFVLSYCSYTALNKLELTTGAPLIIYHFTAKLIDQVAKQFMQLLLIVFVLILLSINEREKRANCSAKFGRRWIEYQFISLAFGFQMHGPFIPES